VLTRVLDRSVFADPRRQPRSSLREPSGTTSAHRFDLLRGDGWLHGAETQRPGTGQHKPARLPHYGRTQATAATRCGRSHRCSIDKRASPLAPSSGLPRTRSVRAANPSVRGGLHRQRVGDLTSCAAFPLTSLGFRNRLRLSHSQRRWTELQPGHGRDVEPIGLAPSRRQRRRRRRSAVGGFDNDGPRPRTYPRQPRLVGAARYSELRSAATRETEQRR
jgi:hypothetical protein